MKKRYLFVVLILIIFFISGCELIKEDPLLSKKLDIPESLEVEWQYTNINKNEFSLESIDKEVKFDYPKNFLLEFKETQEINKDSKKEPFGDIKIIKESLEVDIPKELVYGVSVSGRYMLFNKNSFARAILVDSDNLEWLIFGTDLLFLEGSNSFEKVCDETCVFDKPLSVKEIRVEGIDSSLLLDSIGFKTTKSSEKADVLRERQHDIKLQRLQDEISSKSLTWAAGDTSVSKLLYRDLKKLFIGNELANLNGFQYYKGGIFKL
jgi:hypothetical protein